MSIIRSVLDKLSEARRVALLLVLAWVAVPSFTAPATSLQDSGTEYHAHAMNASGGTTLHQATLAATPARLPLITTQPSDQTVYVGQSATFSVVASSSTPMSYAWFRRAPGKSKWSTIPGANESSYVSPAAILGDNGAAYRVLVMNGAGSVHSKAATLKVLPLPVPDKPVVSLSRYVTAGKAGLVASTQDQGTGVTYLWSLIGGSLTSGQGARSITYRAGLAGTLKATVTVTNAYGSATGAANATVVPAPNSELALPTSAHPGDHWMKASVPKQAGMTYLWTILPGTSTGTLTSGQGTGMVGFSAGHSIGNFLIRADVQNQAGDSVSATRTIQIQTGTWLIKNGGPCAAAESATATLLPSGRVLVAGGLRVFDTLDVTGMLARSELYDPPTGTWTSMSPMAVARWEHTATLLPNGKVLVTGGWAGYADGEDSPQQTATAELYDPATATWASTTGLGTGRAGHTATLLPNGKVLVAGGAEWADFGASDIASAEIFDPATDTWSPTGNLGAGRFSHTATLLPNGLVLVAGGQNASGPLSSAEVYDPATGTWTPLSSMGTARANHTATLLPNGDVLMAGGYDATYQRLASAERFAPLTGTWTPTPGLGATHYGHSATLLADGKVLVAGGGLANVEVYDPASNAWTATGSLNAAHVFHTATQLPNGEVLLAGGSIDAISEFYDPSAGSWTLQANLGVARIDHAATLLPDGTVLVAGGRAAKGSTASAELFTPAAGTWTPTGSLGTAREGHTATLLLNGKVLAAGGGVASAEIYDPSTRTWMPTGPLGMARAFHTATLLANGKVLVTGGLDSSNTALIGAELFDPSTGIWTPTGSLGTARAFHSATLLISGKVLVAGGSAQMWLDSAELYDPATGAWEPTGNLTVPREMHTAIRLANGKVQVAGGSGGFQPGDSTSLTSTEIYDPATGGWSLVGSLEGGGQYNHTATLLPNGNVLVAAGLETRFLHLSPLGIPLASAQTYDPVSETWTATGSLCTARDLHTATLLPDGTVLVAFGSCGAITEIYRP